tara:strand:- start:2501 stop:4090 length:1590 start_codon:yes stop_codon:yes gene_type:complete
MAKQNQAGYPVTVIKPFDEREIQSIASPFVALGNAWKQGQDALTRKQKAIRNREATMYETAYKSLGKIESVDYATFDDNMRSFFDGKVDDYVKIKNNIDSGLINPQEGARSLAYISNMIDEYKTLAPKVLAQAKYMMDNGAGGNNLLSKLNDPNLEILFSKLLEGSGEVTLAEDNKGKMYLKGSGKLDGEDWNYDLNLSEFAKLDGKGDSLAITTVDLDDLGLTDVAKAALEASTYEEQKENGSSIAYTNVDQVKRVLSGPMNNAVVDITKGEDFASVWADQIYKDKTVDELKEENLLWDAADPVKMKTAIDWLIDKAIDINVPIQQQIQFEGRGEDGSFDPTSKMIGVDENSTFNVKPKIKIEEEVTDTQAVDTVRIYATDPIGSMDSTSVDGDVVSTTQKGNMITVTTTKEGFEPNEKTYNLRKEKDFIAYFQKIRERNKRFEGTAQDSQKRKEDFLQELKMEFLKQENQIKDAGARNEISDTYTLEDFKNSKDTSDMSLDEIISAYKKEVDKRVKQLQEAADYKVK